MCSESWIHHIPKQDLCPGKPVLGGGRLGSQLLFSEWSIHNTQVTLPKDAPLPQHLHQ